MCVGRAAKLNDKTSGINEKKTRKKRPARKFNLKNENPIRNAMRCVFVLFRQFFAYSLEKSAVTFQSVVLFWCLKSPNEQEFKPKSGKATERHTREKEKSTIASHRITQLRIKWHKSCRKMLTTSKIIAKHLILFRRMCPPPQILGQRKHTNNHCGYETTTRAELSFGGWKIYYSFGSV